MNIFRKMLSYKQTYQYLYHLYLWKNFNVQKTLHSSACVQQVDLVLDKNWFSGLKWAKTKNLFTEMQTV